MDGAFAQPVLILAGVGVGVSSSVIPYVTDQLALARLRRATYALMVSLLPAIATITYQLERFEIAQNQGGTYATAVAELRAGRKSSHWMWFIFPQIAGLGRSAISRRYAIASRAEAEAYLAHPVLGSRLQECTRILTELAGRTAQDVFGPVDAMKLRSSMTLFARAAPDEQLFQRVLAEYFGGVADEATESRLAALDRGNVRSDQQAQ